MADPKKGAGENSPASNEAQVVNTEELKATIFSLEKTVEEQKEIIEELNANNSALEKKLEEVKTGAVFMPEVEIKGVKYQVNNGTLLNGVKYTRDELAKNPKVCEAILAISGQLTITALEVEEAE